MKVFSIGVDICATAYIRAESEEDALAIARDRLRNVSLELMPQDDGGDLPISGRQYNDPRLPDLSLSPAMSINEQTFEEAMLDLAFDDEEEEA